MRKLLLLLLAIPIISCNSRLKKDAETIIENFNKDFIRDGFDFPVGKPNAKNYYNAQVFGKNAHLGDDWNGSVGGNTDLGDQIYSIAIVDVITAKVIRCGWG